MNVLNKYDVYAHVSRLRRRQMDSKDSVKDLLEHKRDDMTWRDHLVMLLHIGAEIEHSLMVQYLYAAYSLGGDQVPAQHRPMVKRWQDDILAVAKEEMGHLLTVQNILTLLGAPINLGRMDLPWDIPFYPFPFQLEPLTLESVACYVYAEMPSEKEFEDARRRSSDQTLLERYEKFDAHDRKRISAFAHKRAAKHGAHRVGELYDEIAQLLAHRDRIPDRLFQDRTYVFQASVDDWGRGHQPRPRRLDAGGSFEAEKDVAVPATRQAHVMVDRVATRKQAVEAILALSKQGEAPALAEKESDELSHFDRLLEIYQGFANIRGKWQPARKVPTNPSTVHDPDPEDESPMEYIAAKQSREWAGLFNLRYRLLLRYLAHTFQLARTTPAGEPNLRAMVMHRVFGEMYNLKTIAGILVRLPLSDKKSDSARAGPPFEMPYTLDLAGGEFERWAMHRDLVRSSQRLCKRLLASGSTVECAYLTSLFESDEKTAEWMKHIRDGFALTQRVAS